MTGKEQRKAPILRFKGFTDDWEQRKLKDIVSYVKGFAFKSTDYQSHGIRLIRVSDLDKENIKSKSEKSIFLPTGFLKLYAKYTIHRNNIIVTTVGSKSFQEDSAVGKTILVRDKIPCLLNQNLILITTTEKPIFLFEQMTTQKYRFFISTIERGNANQANIAVKDYLKYKIHLTSLSEEICINDLFQKINKLISLQQRKLERSNRLYQGLIKKLFKNQDSWQEIQLAKLVTVLDKKRIPVKRQDRLPGSIPYYGANGIQDHVNNYTHEGSFVLIAEDGANSLTDYPVFHVCGKIWVNNHTHVLKVNPSVNSVFLTIALKRLNFSKYIVGGSRSKLNLKDLKQISLKLPKKQEQDKIGKIYKEIHNLQALEKSTISNLKFVKQFLLQNMFI